MRIEIVLFAVTAFIMANIYYEGKLLKKALGFKKYYQMAGIAFGAFVIYYAMKKNPLRAREMIVSTNDYMKYLPIDKSTSSILSPIIDMTSKSNWGMMDGLSDRTPVVVPTPTSRQPRFMGGTARESAAKIKRSVSETKKKYVASRQKWYCGHCKNLLNHTFEIDHIISLNNGGSNHVDNLVALCPACHREKTSMENMDSQI
jgi:hypothetical protein